MENAGIFVLAGRRKGNEVTMREAITRTNREKLVLLPNKSTDGNRAHGFEGRVAQPDIWTKEMDVYPAWTGTMRVYAKPGKKPGRYIHYKDENSGTTYTFEVPVEARKEKDVIILLNHGFTSENRPVIELIDEGKNRVFVNVADKSKIEVIACFAREDGWYRTEDKFGVTIGKKLESEREGAQYMWRNRTMVGLIARAYYGIWRYWDTTYRPSEKFGALVMRPKFTGSEG